MADEERARKCWASIKEACAAQLLEHPEANQKDADRLVARRIAAALAAERERCARICERLGSQIDGTMDQHRDRSWQQSARDKIGMADKCAAAIRALGEK